MTPQKVTPPRPPPLPEMPSEEAAGISWLKKDLSAATESDTSKPEGVSKHSTSLPVSKGLALCVAGDWLTQIGPTVKSLSATATTWWNEVWERSHKLYKQWLAADPQERFTITATKELRGMMAPNMGELNRPQSICC